jgi:cation diffusion facilitator family transporter
VIGITCHSSALMADAGHSLSDLFSDFVTLWAVQVARLPPDQDHPYGHGKFEAIGSLFLSLTLIGTAIGIGIMSNNNLLDILAIQRRTAAAAVAATANTAIASSLHHQYPIPSYPALIMAFISVVSKEWLFRITRVVGQRLQSQVVIANAWHHRTDAYSSILSSASIALAMFVPGLLFVDAAAGLFVAAMIGMTGMEILGESVKQLTDTSNEELVQKVTKLANDNVDVDQVVRVRARQVGSVSTVDISVTMPEDRTASAARAVEERLKQQILQSTIDENVIDVDVRATAPTAILTSSSSSTTTIDTDTINGEDTTKSLGLDSVSNTPSTINDASTETTTFTTTPTTTKINTINTIDALMTVEEVKSYIENEILFYHSNTILSVSGITVYYRDILLKMIDVDVHVRLVQQQQQQQQQSSDNNNINTTSTTKTTNPIIRIQTIADATLLCSTIRQTILQNSKQITNAKVYIDLN